MTTQPRCPRCGGEMVLVPEMDVEDDEDFGVEVLTCEECGEVVDDQATGDDDEFDEDGSCGSRAQDYADRYGETMQDFAKDEEWDRHAEEGDADDDD